MLAGNEGVRSEASHLKVQSPRNSVWFRTASSNGSPFVLRLRMYFFRLRPLVVIGWAYLFDVDDDSGLAVR
jgi:hypothetical protein